MVKENKIEWYRWISPIFVICVIIFGGGSMNKTIKDSNEAIQANTITIQANTKSIMQNTIGIAIDVVEDNAFQKSVDLHIQQTNDLMKDMASDIKTLLLKDANL